MEGKRFTGRIFYQEHQRKFYGNVDEKGLRELTLAEVGNYLGILQILVYVLEANYQASKMANILLGCILIVFLILITIFIVR